MEIDPVLLFLVGAFLLCGLFLWAMGRCFCAVYGPVCVRWIDRLRGKDTSSPCWKDWSCLFIFLLAPVALKCYLGIIVIHFYWENAHE